MLTLYRQLLKTARDLKTIEPTIYENSTDEIKTHFRMSQPLTSPEQSSTVAVLIRDGEQHLEMLIDLKETRKQRLEKSSPAHATGWAGKVNEDGSDQRGRIGKKFPWQK